jgi:hypothetical protein
LKNHCDTASSIKKEIKHKAAIDRQSALIKKMKIEEFAMIFCISNYPSTRFSDFVRRSPEIPCYKSSTSDYLCYFVCGKWDIYLVNRQDRKKSKLAQKL